LFLLNGEARETDLLNMAFFGRARLSLPHNPDRWKQALEAVLEVNEIASSSAALDHSVNAVLGVAVELLGAEEGSIMLLEEDGRTLGLVAAHGLPADVRLGYQLAVGESVAGRVLATGKPLLLGSVDQDAFVNFVPKSRAIASSVVVPLRTQGRVLGVLNLATARPSTAFTDEDLRVAQLFADQAAGVINRTRLHERAERRSSDLMALVGASKHLLGTLDLDSLLKHILDGGTRLTGARRGFLCLFDGETGSVERGVFRNFEKAEIRAVIANPELQRAVSRTAVALMADSNEADLLAVVGLRTPRGNKGVLVVAPDQQLFNDRRDLLMAFGQQSASALGAAELHSMVLRKESELASIIQGVPNPIVLVDSQRRIVALNSAAENLFGATAAFTEGVSVAGALGNDEIERLLLGHGDFGTECVAGNPPRTYKARIADVRMPGAPIGRVLIMDDVTAEREIVQTQRDFVSMIGHELRTPLTVITGFSRTLMKRVDTAPAEEAREALATIDAKAQQLGRLIEDLLYVSQIEARESRLRIEDTDVAQLVQEVANETLQQYPGRELFVDVVFPTEWPCDSTKVSLVLRHLIDNALKYSRAPSPVVVRAQEVDHELIVEVEDKGEGILSSDIPHIFERFRQVDSSSTRVHGGTGVGLYLCAQLMRIQGGRIWVDSTWGKGSVFSFSLPHPRAGHKVVRLGSPSSQTG
jgi:signal transduction histidine kinase